MSGQHSTYSGEDALVRAQSKVEKAKYVHTENNLRRNLANISESFKRTNKRLNDETETLKAELLKLRRSVEKVREEKEKRMMGDYRRNRRPYQAERFLCNENIVTVRPFYDSSPKLVNNRKSSRKQSQRRLAPIKLHQNKRKDANEETLLVPDKNDHELVAMKTALCKLPKIQTSLQINDKPTSINSTVQNEIHMKQISKENKTFGKHISIEEVDHNHNHLEVPRIPICDLMDTNDHYKRSRASAAMQSKPHFLPPLEMIVEDEVVERR